MVDCQKVPSEDGLGGASLTCRRVVEVSFVDKDGVEFDGAGSLDGFSEGGREGQLGHIGIGPRHS